MNDKIPVLKMLGKIGLAHYYILFLPYNIITIIRALQY